MMTRPRSRSIVVLADAKELVKIFSLLTPLFAMNSPRYLTWKINRFKEYSSNPLTSNTNIIFIYKPFGHKGSKGNEP
jgi:hypothetical protein